ncbi:hypothetical protein TWF102_006936 [Orbilia oligospora]|uniref:Deacetylase sirtuin-type domain-containing protein n=1 Tax=Orbilia oligospora TaxID=2813651 RepID=A0A7C8NX38_ORBOL|nr:hypothetical protein TWF103_005808 [Orbilia oligospora]KAF3111263.1 hypothetical protein TWF102_006936 [Orbilia oligospora]KAF3114252.1 hypothetical protein TWF706_008189 [Orbilia oligospora]
MPTQTIGAQHAQELQEIADSICRSCQVLMVTGAGISTNSGIPDFRSADGLYNLVKRRYPEQTALLKGKDLFDAISFTNPITTAILYSFLAELRQNVKGITDSTPTHKFIKTLSETGRLLRCYTQNIDGLEALDGLCMDISRGAGKRGKGKEKVGREAGCEVVQLHGDLELLRCTQCAKLHNYDEERVETLLGGEAPECPDCSRKADDRLAAGKRSINVGTLRPNIVLYDELHPQGEAIGQITHYDATRMTPDLLLIFGTSLKVIGLKRIVKAFASKVKTRGGKVVYINATPAADSIWGDTIDYHIQMDCDAWIKDLKLRRKEIWLHQSLLDKEWRKTKLASLTKSKTTTGYESDKENSGKLRGQPLVRRKSLSSLPSKKKSGNGKEKQLPTPTNTPRKRKPSSAPNTPILSASKRAYNAAFPTGTSPLTSLGTTPGGSHLSTPSKRIRLSSTPLPPMNATTTPHHHRIQNLGTPQRASPGARSWVTMSDNPSMDSFSTPTQRLNLNTPDRPIPDSPLLTEHDTEPKTPSREVPRFFLDYIAVPSLFDAPPSSPPQKLQGEEPCVDKNPSTPRRPTLSEVSSLTNSIRTSASPVTNRHGLLVDQIDLDDAPSPTPTPTRPRLHISKQLLSGYNLPHSQQQIPTPPDSQVPSDLDQSSSNLSESITENYEDDVKYRPRVRSSKRRIFVDDAETEIGGPASEAAQSIQTEVTEVDEQLEREADMAMKSLIEAGSSARQNRTYYNEEDEEIEDVDLVPSRKLPTALGPTVVAETSSDTTANPAQPALENLPFSESPSIPPLTPDATTKSRRKTISPAILGTIERRRTRGLEKDEAILKALSKPGTVTRKEAERRKSLKAEFKGFVQV